MVSWTSRPGWPSSRDSSRMTRPTALTSSWLVPAVPRSAFSWYFTTPALPIRKPGSDSTGSPFSSASATAPT